MESNNGKELKVIDKLYKQALKDKVINEQLIKLSKEELIALANTKIEP